MKVLKFGGTSVGSVDIIKKLPVLLKREMGNSQLVMVVSAFSGVTNQLSTLTDTALLDFAQAEKQVLDLKNKHLKFYQDLTGKEESSYINELFENIFNVCRGISLLHEVTTKSRDFLLTSGELLSSHIISEYLSQELNIQLFNSKDYLIAGKGNKINLQKSQKLINEINELKDVNLFPGFIAAKENGTTTSLGRGGSDYTASLLAHLFNAEELQIWTDVSGIMSADPRFVRQAKVLKHLSYEEALELSHFGAKVIYPPSIQPALTNGIPIRIKNTFAPDEEGTLITKEWDQNKEIIQGISSIKNVVLININGAGMVGIPSFSHRFFKVLSERMINIIMITQASSEHSICVAITRDELAKALEGLKEEFEIELTNKLLNEIEVEYDLAIIALVGSNMRDQVGVSGKMFNTLGKNGISIKAIAQGSSERNISAVIPETHLRKALNTLHESFFLSERKRINLFVIGVGNVGQSFIQQVKAQEQFLEEEHNIKMSLVGIANSKKMVFEEEGLDLGSWKEILQKGGNFSHDTYLQQMKAMNLRNSVFVDITASDAIASLYKEILASNISVVTPNKLAATSAYESYRELLDLGLKNNVQFLFETNVAAGLPVLSTLKDLVRSGDKIQRIEAVLSGTLNYLFNTYDGSVKFVDVIKDAKEKGLTEPDPRLDLFGEDVRRKILILARESGTQMKIDEVSFAHFVPQECVEAPDLDTFYSLVEKKESHFLDLNEKAEAQQANYRVVASFENGKASVSLKAVTEEHPFYNLEGKDNIVLFYTSRYSEQPLVIKGAGAGADVTASGIFADVLKTILS